MTRCFEFEVTLQEIQPRIWRRFLIDSKANFLHLHEAIQAAGPWQNYHLFCFQTRKGKMIAGIPDPEFGKPDPDARRVKLALHFGRRGMTSCKYIYDFGDDWAHEVVLRSVVETPRKVFRSLVDGALSFPPEDSGGPHAYESWVEVATGRRKDRERKEWLGDWKPDGFDLAKARQQFDLKKRPRLYAADYGF